MWCIQHNACTPIVAFIKCHRKKDIKTRQIQKTEEKHGAILTARFTFGGLRCVQVVRVVVSVRKPRFCDGLASVLRKGSAARARTCPMSRLTVIPIACSPRMIQATVLAHPTSSLISANQDFWSGRVVSPLGTVFDALVLF
jgi:hypothetical protein